MQGYKPNVCNRKVRFTKFYIELFVLLLKGVCLPWYVEINP
jgi:hypothetical protein